MQKTWGVVFPLIVAIAVTLAIIVLILGVAAYYFTPAALALTSDQSRFWEVALKAIAGTIAVVGGIITVAKYFDDKTEARTAAEREAARPYEEKRREIIYQLLDTTATIANRSVGDVKRASAEARFWQLYWGVSSLVTNQDITAALNEFHIILADHPDWYENLRNASLRLATACRAAAF